MKDNIFEIDHYAITVRDLKKTREFYESILGFEFAGQLLTEDGNDVLAYPSYEDLTGVPGVKFKIMFMKGYGITLEFLEYVYPEEIVIDTKPYIRGTAHLCFHAKDAQKAYEELSRKGVELCVGKAVRIEGGTHEGVCAFYFKDPDGFLLEIKTEAGD